MARNARQTRRRLSQVLRSSKPVSSSAVSQTSAWPFRSPRWSTPGDALELTASKQQEVSPVRQDRWPCDASSCFTGRPDDLAMICNRRTPEPVPTTVCSRSVHVHQQHAVQISQACCLRHRTIEQPGPCHCGSIGPPQVGISPTWMSQPGRSHPCTSRRWWSGRAVKQRLSSLIWLRAPRTSRTRPSMVLLWRWPRCIALEGL